MSLVKETDMSEINFQAIYDKNRHGWYEMTNNPQKYEALLAGHYSESNHFVYELLQNAEDERADTVVFEYYENQLVFYHNGRPFDEADVRSITSLLMGTKTKNDAQTIGKFGMGFKSVFKYTCQPEIYSDETAFRIKNYLLPEEIKRSWNYQSVKEKLKYPNTDGKYFFPFSEAEHLTKFVIPFKKRNERGKTESVSGEDVLQKLKDLPAEILLFLTYIKNLYWIDQTNGKFVMISYETDESDENLISCRKAGSGQGKDGKTVKYLKFRKKFNHPEMKGAEVSVAYRLNNRANNIKEIPGSDIWVYFPTRDHTQLPFMIHGSFETAVSREKLMSPSKFNDDLFNKLGDLICESLVGLRKRHLITQSFIRSVLLEAFKDENDNNTIPGLKEKVTALFAEKRLLPDTEGNYCAVNSLKIAVPYDLADFVKDKRLVVFNNEKEANFTEYFNWLTKDLHLQSYTLQDWANDIEKQYDGSVRLQKNGINRMEKLYNFLQKYKAEFYSYQYRYNRISSAYELKIRSFIKNAWESLRQVPIIVNAENKLVSAYEGEKPCVYLSSSSDYKNVLRSSIVNPTIAEEFRSLLKDDFGIGDFDNYQYVKEKVIRKYVEGDDINFDNPEDYESEYVEDINQIIELFKTSKNTDEIQELLKDAYIIKTEPDDDDNDVESTFALPGEAYIPISDEGIDLKIYYDMGGEDAESFSVRRYQLDTLFYEQNNISLKDLRLFGIVTSPVKEGVRSYPGGAGNESWKALGEYCPKMEVEDLKDNLAFLERYPGTDLARKKSKEIFKLVCEISKKFSGSVQHRKTHSYTTVEENNISRMLKDYRWLYDKNDEPQETFKMSKSDLNTELYGPLPTDRSIYEALGFYESESDRAEKVLEAVNELDEKSQRILLKQLGIKYGSEMLVDKDTEEASDEGDSVFRMSEWTSSEFPVSPIRSLDNLKQHVRQQFYCADPVKYEKVWRQIRTSKPQDMARSYVIGMYTNNANAKICQMCKQPSSSVEAIEIANYGIELPQLHLCLCNNCARKYQTLKATHKDKFAETIKEALREMDVSGDKDVYEVKLNDGSSISFTPTHVAELQTIFELMDTCEDSSTMGERQDNNDDIKSLVEKAQTMDVGTNVYHVKFGEGTITEVIQGRLIRVKFNEGTEKSFKWENVFEGHCLSLE